MGALSESALQIAFIKWCRTQEDVYPELRWMHHIPNGGSRSGREASSLKEQGVKAGILDLSLDVARGKYHGWKFELKKPGSKEKPSDLQDEYIEFCIDNGYYANWSNDFDDVKKSILWYLGLGKFTQEK